MKIAKKLLLVLLVLCVGLGGALLFRKGPDSVADADLSNHASGLTSSLASVSSGRISLRYQARAIPEQASPNPDTGSDEFAIANDFRSDSERAYGVDRNGPRDVRRDRSHVDGVPGSGRSPAARCSDQTREATTMVRVLVKPPTTTDVPALPDRFPNATKSGRRLRPAYPTVDMRDRPVRSGDEAARVMPDTHRIVDGDTLEGLAEYYLGDSQRATEIFQLNQDRINNPSLLPIGVELRLRP